MRDDDGIMCKQVPGTWLADTVYRLEQTQEMWSGEFGYKLGRKPGCWVSERGVGENCKAGKSVGGVVTKMEFPIRLQKGLLVEQMWLTEG